MSGVYKPLIIGLGAFSSILCVWIVSRLGILKTASAFSAVSPVSLVSYFVWLVKEIGKADWAVTKVILGAEIPDDQRLIGVATSQKSDLARMLFANSITITPGTITVETEPDRFIVHALNQDAADPVALTKMNDRVTATERSPHRPPHRGGDS